MNDRERILTMLSGGVPDRVPWFGDLAYWAAAMEHRGLVPKNWQLTEDYYRFHRELGVGFYLQGYWAFREIQDSSVVVTEKRDGDRRIRTVRTPVGALREVWRFLEEPCTWAPVEHMVKGVADLPALRTWYEHTHYEPAPEEAVQRRPWVDGLGVVLCYLPRSPFMELTAILAGIRHIVDMWLEAPDAFDETMASLYTSFDRAAEAALQVPADCFMIPENLSSEVVGRRFYERYVAAWERKWVQRIREADKFSFIHMDGTLGGLLRQVAATGFDVIEAATPQPVGDLPVHHWREVAGPGTILWGGIPGVYFTALVSDAEFDRHVRETLEVMVEDKRMVLGVADQVPPDGLRSRVAHVVELVERYGQY
ncbi:MAG: hypothetical protein FJZ90_12865, partial [Chloroflexi bacterium]|nr:hypothetical protein [Chloroflexota bacterium]